MEDLGVTMLPLSLQHWSGYTLQSFLSFRYRCMIKKDFHYYPLRKKWVLLINPVQMNQKNTGSKYAILVGFPISVLLCLFAFSESYYIDWMMAIGDFKSIENDSNLFWGILFPIIYLILLWNSAINIDSNINTKNYFQTCSDFSFQTAKKILLLLFVIYFIGLLINGISAPLHIMFLDKIFFSIILILSFSLFLIFITFLTSLIIVKLTQTKLKQQ